MSGPVRVGVFFGGRSVEHEVSVITAQQVMAAMPPDRMHPVPVYIAKSGAWYTGDQLLSLERFRDIDRLITDSTRVMMRAEPASGGDLLEVAGRRGIFGGSARSAARFDVAMPLVHGSHGEDGTLQGLFELADVAYCGCGVVAAALSMDKPLTRALLRSAGLPVLDEIAITRARWEADADRVCAELTTTPGFPMFIKPRSLGSSIGVARAESAAEARTALDAALTYDVCALAEPEQRDIIEINCSVLGAGDDVRVSVCEQPVSSGLLSYADKYLAGPRSKGGAKPRDAGMKSARRIIPAQISDSLTARIREAAATSFRAIGAAGVARVDFLVSPERETFVVNELNTVPGSLSFYLWEPSGLAFADLVERVVDIAVERRAAKRATTFSIDTWLLTGPPA